MEPPSKVILNLALKDLPLHHIRCPHLNRWLQVITTRRCCKSLLYKLICPIKQVHVCLVLGCSFTGISVKVLGGHEHCFSDVGLIICGHSSIGRVPVFQTGCCGIVPRWPLQVDHSLLIIYRLAERMDRGKSELR